ncbi:MAG: hypothetical protein K6G36_02725 [Candidatus Saccharibacteria bacterium]|nr:hypothetical protein [Candidatus Saccharibacteria bacterium]
MKKLDFILTGLLGVIFLSTTSTSTFANTKESGNNPIMQVAPVIDELSLDPGTQADKSIRVANHGDQKLNVRVYAAPYSIIKETGGSDFKTQSEYTQIYHWIKIQTPSSDFAESAHFSIEPGKAETINYRITVPESAPGGSQHACIFVETVPDDSEESSSIITVSRTAVKIFADVSGKTVKDAEITALESNSDIILGGKIFARASIENTGNVDIRPNLTLKVTSSSGETVFDNTKTAMILPENQSQMEIYWPNTPMFGIYHIIAVVSVLGKSEVIEKQIIIVPVWFVILLLLITLTIILIVCYRKRRSKMEKSLKKIAKF